MVILIFLLLIFICISVLIFKLLKFNKLTLYKNLLGTFFCTILILNIIFSPKACLNSALYGGKLFITSVFPSIFPFLVIINVMMHFDGINIYSKAFGTILCKPLRLPRNCSVVLIVSILCGYPLGAKYACDLYKKNLISLHTCHRLINIASNPSPIFVLGTIGASMLKNPSLGFLLLISTYLSCIIMSMLIPYKKQNYCVENSVPIIPKNNITLGEILKLSVDNALKTAFAIGGFIVFFSVLISIIKNNTPSDIVFKNLSAILNINQSSLEGLFFGLFEMTNGCSLITSASIDTMYKICILSFLLGFSGLSIICQTYSLIYKSKISLMKYTKKKFIQGIICSILTMILYKSNIFNTSISAFNYNLSTSNINVFIPILIIQTFIIIVPILIYNAFKLFNRIS